MRSRPSRLAALVAAPCVALALGVTGTAAAATPDLDCADFTYQEDAQAVLDSDPTDPNGLDADGDGIACESLPHRPTTTTPTVPPTTTPTTTTPTTTTAPATTTVTTTPTTAGTPTRRHQHHGRGDDHHEQDGSGTGDGGTDDDGGSGAASGSTTTGAGPTQVTATGSDTTTATRADRDCADFPTQAAAQATLDADPSDPDRLDGDGDGIACESTFGTEDQQVAVVPIGGVDTGGYPA